MAKVGTAEYDVEISRRKVQQEVDAASRTIEKGLGDSAERAAREMEQKLGRLREGLGVGFLAGTTLALKSSVDAASALTEAQGKARAVFAESYDEVKRFAEGAATSLGQSEQQVLSSVGTYGNLLQAMGLTTEQAQEMSIELVKLGTDLAAFSDIPIDDAITALRSGLSGETEPLKRFGVNLNDARLKQEALNLGLYDGKGQLDANAKAQAAYNIIMQDTVLAQGTFNRESDTFAARQRVARAELENTSAEIGQALLPVMADLASAVGTVARAFGSLPGPVQTGIVGIGGLTLAAGLLGPRLAEGARLMQFAGRRGVEMGKNLIVPKSAVEGLGTSTDRASGSVGRFGKALGALALAGATYELIQMGRAMSEFSYDAEQALAAPTEGLAEVATAIAAIEPEAFNDIDLTVLYALRDAVAETGGEAIPALSDAIAKAEKDTATAAQRTDKYAAELDEVTGSAETAATASATLSRETESLMDIFEANAQAAREVFDARRSLSAADKGVADAQRAVADASKGVRDAQRGLSEAYDGVADAARGVQDAERGVADARERLADASENLARAQFEQAFGNRELEDANKGVERAELALADAQRASLDAQEALNDARKTAAERLADLEEAVDRQALDEREARLSLAEARERQRTLGDGDREVTALDRERAAIAIERAEQRLADVLEANAEREALLAEEQAKGIEQSDEVIAAKEGIEQAADDQREAEESLTEAQQRVVEVQEDLAARVVEAQGEVEDAQRGVEDATRRVQDAYDGVRDAQQRVVDQREAVVEARQAVAEAEEGVNEALLNQIERAAEVIERTDGVREATKWQIGEYERLAETLSPNDPLRQHLRGLIDDLREATGTWIIDVGLSIDSTFDGLTENLLDVVDTATRRAGGGRVVPGQPYLVGDRYGLQHAEVMVPDEPGVVVPSLAEWDARNGGTGSGSAPTINITSPVTDTLALAADISAIQGWAVGLESY